MDVDNIAKHVANVQIIEDDDEEIIEVESDSLNAEVLDLRWALVGRFLIERPEKTEYMKRVITAAWKPGMGVSILELDLNLFLFQFGHEADVHCVLEGGPWSYNNNVLLLKRVNPSEEPRHKTICSLTL